MVKPVLLVRPFRDYLLTPHFYFSLDQHIWKASIKPIYQQFPSSHYETASYQTPGPAVSPLPMQVSYSTMQLRPPTRPQSPPTILISTDRYHTHYEINAHQSLEPTSINRPLSTNYSWQTVKKRKLTHRSPTLAARGLQSPFNSPNSFAQLSHLQDDDNQAPVPLPSATPSSDQTTKLRVHKPPPIYVYGLTNYCDMMKYLAGTLEDEQYYCKTLPNETVKININSPDTYGRLVKPFQEDNILYHTYQITDERAYRVVLRNLHHSIPPHDIKEELETLDIRPATY